MSRRSSRARTSRFIEVDGHKVLKLNNYQLGQNLSVLDAEAKDYGILARVGKQHKGGGGRCNHAPGRTRP